jgi:beta-xylosidase
LENEKAGLTVMGFSYANLALKSKKDGVYLVYTICKDAQNGKSETEKEIMKMASAVAYLRVKITRGAKCRFSYSFDGNNFTEAGDEFQAEVGRWIGAKVGLFCTRTSQTNDSGYGDFDWFRIEPSPGG